LQDCPELIDDSDSESDDEQVTNINRRKKIHTSPDDPVAQFGNDIVLENDPIPIGSNRKIRTHKRIPPPIHEIEPEHFVVEKILNHKGSVNRPSSMQLFVKWHGWDDSENSWISWRDNNNLAAIDTYLENNPEIVVPVFAKQRHRPILRKKQLKLAKRTAKRHLKKLSLIDEQYTVNFLPSKCMSITAAAIARLSQPMSFGAFRQVPAGVPRSYVDIERQSNPTVWLDSTSVEFANMYKNTVWYPDLIDEKSILKSLILPSQLLYEIQINPDGTLKKYKCRLVIRGDKWYDIYEMDTYASTVKSETVKICLAIAATEDMEMESVDVKAAFLNSPLKDDEIIYMRRPPGLNDSHMPKIVRLKKCIYGMKQASAYFHAHSDAVLKSFGCVPTEEDDCCYTLNHQGQTAIIIKHVDDFGLMSKSQSLLTFIKTKLSEAYEITVDPEMKFYLGHHLVRDRKNKKIWLDQSAMIMDMAVKFDIPTDGPFPSTPMEYMQHHDKPPAILLNDKEKQDYQSRVGSILYVARHTRTDTLFSVAISTTKTQNPTTADLTAVNRIITYLVGTKDLALQLGSDEGVILYATVDASYATHEDSKSHTGCTLHIGRDSGAVIAISKKQKITSDSSTIAEFIATHVVAKEIIWCRGLLKSLGYPQLSPTVLFEDNQSTISMIKNKCNGKRTKHIDVRYNMIRELCAKMIIIMTYLASKEMTSDTLTKALAPAPFIHLRKKIMGNCAIKMMLQRIFNYF